MSNSRRSRGCRRRTRNFLFHHPSPFRKPRGSIPRDKSAITIFDYRLYANSREVILCVVHHRIESNNKISHCYHPLSCLFLSFLLLLPLLFFSFFFFFAFNVFERTNESSVSRATFFRQDICRNHRTNVEAREMDERRKSPTTMRSSISRT